MHPSAWSSAARITFTKHSGPQSAERTCSSKQQPLKLISHGVSNSAKTGNKRSSTAIPSLENSVVSEAMDHSFGLEWRRRLGSKDDDDDMKPGMLIDDLPAIH